MSLRTAAVRPGGGDGEEGDDHHRGGNAAAGGRPLARGRVGHVGVWLALGIGIDFSPSLSIVIPGRSGGSHMWQ